VPGYHCSSARAGVAHLVERDLAKVEVAGSKPVSRSTFSIRNRASEPGLTPTVTPTRDRRPVARPGP
jgi:hypothetical protein